MNNTPIHTEEERLDGVLSDFIENDRSYYLLLYALDVDEDDDEVFEDALYSSLGAGVIKASEFQIIEKYIGREDFRERFQRLLSTHSGELEKIGFTLDDLQIVGERIKHHIDMIVSKFDIYRYIGDQEGFTQNYGTLCKSQYGDIILARDGTKAYLFNGAFHFGSEFILDQSGNLGHILFYFPDHTIHVDIEKNSVWKIPGEPTGMMKRNGLNGLISHTDKDEILTILETQDVMKKDRTKLDEGKTHFLNIYSLGKSGEDIVVKYVGAEARVIRGKSSEDEEEEENPKVGLFITQNLYSLTSGEQLFSTCGNIRDVIQTPQGDTYIIEEIQVFNPDRRDSGYTSTQISVYSLADHCYRIQGIPAEQEVQFEVTDDNLLIINTRVQNKYIYSCRNQTMIGFLSLGNITHYSINGGKQIHIEFIDEDGKGCYDSQDDGFHGEGGILEVERNYH